MLVNHPVAKMRAVDITDSYVMPAISHKCTCKFRLYQPPWEETTQIHPRLNRYISA